MQKLVIVICLALMPILSWGAPQLPARKTAEKSTIVVALTGIHSRTISSIRSHVYSETAYAALNELKDISVIHQKTITALNLNIEENNNQSFEKAAELIKADKIVSFFIEQNNSLYTVTYYVYEGRSGALIFTKKENSSDTIENLRIIRNCITESENILMKSGFKRADRRQIPTAKEIDKETTKESGKEPAKEVTKMEPNWLNVELSLYDFVNKKFNINEIFHNNDLMIAVNYKMRNSSKDLALTFGPYFSQNHGCNDLGLRTSGFFYPNPTSFGKVYVSVLGAGFYRFQFTRICLSGEVKLGIELPLLPVELFAEVGIGMQIDSIYVNLMVNSGVRFYIF